MKNKKKTIYLIALLLITTMLFAGCSDNKKPENQNVDYAMKKGFSVVLSLQKSFKTKVCSMSRRLKLR